MVSSSKILTVSYGTFSCTAEGFEDPLAVVKDTTHFFRSVVREDRFFGAEPPQFDPELAAQLLQAQVDAEARGGRLVLRGPLADVAAPMTQGVAQAAVPPAASPVVGPDADRGMEQALAETAARAAAEAAAEAEAEAAAIAAAAEAEVELQDALEDEPLQPAEDTLAAEAAFFAAEAGQDSDDYDYEDSAIEVSAPAGRPAAAAAAPRDEADDSVAAKLRRIRAVVSGGAVAPVAMVQEDEERDGEDTVAAVSAMLGSLASDEDEAAPEMDVDEESIAAALMEQDEDDWDIEDVAEEQPAVAPLALTPDLAAKPAVAPEVVAMPRLAAEPRRPQRKVRVVKVTRAAFDKAVAAGQLEEMPAPKPASSLSAEDEAELARELEAVKAELAAGLESEWDEVTDLDTLSAVPGAEAPHAPVVAEAAIAGLEAETGEDDSWDEDTWDEEAWDAADWDAEDDDDEEEAAQAAAQPARAEEDEVAELEDEDEAFAEDFAEDLDDEDFDDEAEEDADEFAAAFDDTPEAARREAAGEQDDLEDAIARMAQQDVRKAVKMSSPARVMLTEQSVEDNDTSRILDETNTQMEEPEGNRRRSAIAHLRAAVAATRADRLLGRKKDVEAQAQPYREDLADVVRPRRPASALRSERPVEVAPQRPAPLKLVAEQRVDESLAETPAAALRPRRVTLADIDTEEDFGGQGDFADYADSVGAHDLPELLEAAAAYLSYVEGRAEFSRPQLMTKVRQVESQDTSREDRLRSFGQLLRDGKIEKAGGGRFTVSDRISFKPNARAAG